MNKTYEVAWEPDFYDEVDPYRELRRVLAPEYAILSPQQLEGALAPLLGETSLEDLESFWKNVTNFGRSAVGVAQRALPGVVQGASAGSVAGPWGALVGGLAGGALSAARGANQSQPRRPVTPPASVPTPSMPLQPAAVPRPGQSTRISPRTSSGVRPAQGTPAAAQILNLISRPEFQQALMAMLMGSAGQRQVSVGNVQAPLGAFTNLLGVLANRASAEYHQIVAGEAAGTPEYLLDEAGEFLCDPANSEERSDLLWNRLTEITPEFEEYYDSEYLEEEDEYYYDDHDEEYEDEWVILEREEMYDAMDLAQAYEEEEDNWEG